MEYYVYIHYDMNGVPFYVGKGKKGRAYSSSGRTEEWAQAAAGGYTVKIFAEDLNEEDALKREMGLIHAFGRIIDGRGTLVNKQEQGGCTQAAAQATVYDTVKSFEPNKSLKFLHRPIKVLIINDKYIRPAEFLSREDFQYYCQVIKPYVAFCRKTKKYVLLNLYALHKEVFDYGWTFQWRIEREDAPVYRPKVKGV